MVFVQKNLKYIIALVSVFFILQASLIFYNKYHEYSTPNFGDLLLRYLAVIAVYALLFYQVYRLRKVRHVVSILIEILALAAAASVFIVLPVVYARTVGIISNEVGYLYIAEVNMLFALFLSITVYMTKYISYGLSKIVFLLSINAVFIVNCVAIAILYTTGFEIGPTVLLHFSWEAVKIGLGEHLLIFLVMMAALIPVNIIFLRIIKTHKDSVINYSVVCLAALTIMANSVILNFDLYKTRTILPVFSIIDTTVRYSDSNTIATREEYSSIILDSNEKRTLSQLGINLGAQNTPENINPPAEITNLITIYLESFQLNFTKHGNELYPDLTPQLNSLPKDYAIYGNFINSVTPTINTMLSSQCGADIILSTGILEHNNDVLMKDAVTKDLLEDNLVCLSDILHAAGYYQVMMKGADMSFSGKGKFFRSHHYDETLGLSELNATQRYTDLNIWGLQDPMLFDEALNMLTILKNKQPFNLTFLTVNTHTPGYEYSDCPKYKPGKTMLNAIHCTDHALGAFLKKLETMNIYKNTAVVIVGDHVMFNSLSNRTIFKDIPLSWYGRTFLAIRSPDAMVKHSNDIFSITPDLAPTILSLLGFDNINFVSGQSLLGSRREHQRITTSSFDIVNGKMIPDRVENLLNKCTIAEAANERAYNVALYNECQRARVHYLQQKAIYR